MQLHTHQSHSFNCRGVNLCNAGVSLVSASFASMISQEGNYTTIMLGGITIQLHAHQLHNNNCWGINCVIIPAPMVCQALTHEFQDESRSATQQQNAQHDARPQTRAMGFGWPLGSHLGPKPERAPKKVPVAKLKNVGN